MPVTAVFPRTSAILYRGDIPKPALYCRRRRIADWSQMMNRSLKLRSRRADDDDNPVKGSVRTFTLARRRVSPTEHPSEPAVFVLDSGYADRFPRVETLVTHPSSDISVAVQRKVQV